VVLLAVSALRLLSTSGRSRDRAGIKTQKYLHAPAGLTTAAARPPASLANRVTACVRMESGATKATVMATDLRSTNAANGIPGWPVAHTGEWGVGVHAIAGASSRWVNCIGSAVRSRDCRSETGTLPGKTTKGGKTLCTGARRCPSPAPTTSYSFLGADFWVCRHRQLSLTCG